MKRIGETETLVVEVVAELVEKGAEKGLELDHLRPLRRAHPERDPEAAFLIRLIETVKLARLPRRSPLRDAHPERGNAEGYGQSVHERLGGELRRSGVAAREGALERLDALPMGFRSIQGNLPDGVALVVDFFLSWRQTLIVGEAQRRFRGSGLGLDLERPTPGETGFELVPVPDVGLAELPAEVHLSSLPEGGKVDQAGVEILEMAAARTDVFDQGLKLGDEGEVARGDQSSASKRDLLGRWDLGAASLELLMDQT
jgi:hypothetical protein